jgi:CelD/BcsL family acetyltransferase involved in cellulose biosynthesis
MSYTALFRADEAEIARNRIGRQGPIAVDTSLGTVQVRLSSDPQSLAAVWKELQEASPCTGAQTLDWAKAWTCQVLHPNGSRAVIAVGMGADGQILFLWPFEMGRCAGMGLLRWLGQGHANYNMGLFVPGIAPALTAGDMSRLMAAVARSTGAAAALLEAQPFAFDGIPNPFAKLPHQLAPSSGYAVTLGDFRTLYEHRFSKRSRHTLERKARKIADMGAVTYGWGETKEERLELLETFFAQKAQQFAAMGIKNIFDAEARAFYRKLVLLEDDNPSRLRLGYIKLGEEVLAIFSGTFGHKRLLIVLCSLASGDLQRQSPGALLIKHQIEEACAEGLAFYDFGAGSGRHKEDWSDVEEPLFDNFIAFKPRGLVLTAPLVSLSRLKRSIKSDPRLWSFAQALRARLFGKSGVAS